MESNEAENTSSAEPQTPTDTTANKQDAATGAAEQSGSESGSEGGAASNSKKKVQRFKKGTIPPGLTLEEAADIITSYYEQTGGEQTTLDPLSSITNNSSASSVFWRKFTSLKNFGLLIQDENKRVSLTPLGFRIAAPHDPAERAAGLREAFLNVEIFKNAYERYKGKILPLDEFLRHAFTSYVAKELAPEWVEKFKASAYTAGVLENRNGKVQVREGAAVPPADSGKEKPPTEVKSEATVHTEGVQKQVEAPPADVTRTPIPLGPNRIAYIELPKGWESKDLKKLLRLLTLALGDDSEESERILSSL